MNEYSSDNRLELRVAITTTKSFPNHPHFTFISNALQADAEGSDYYLLCSLILKKKKKIALSQL